MVPCPDYCNEPASGAGLGPLNHILEETSSMTTKNGTSLFLAHHAGWCAALALSLNTLACSDDPAGTPTDVEGTGGNGSDDEEDEIECPDPNDAVDPTAMIDDFEDQDALLLPIGGRSGGWWTAGDETPEATIDPALGTDAAPSPINGGRCGSSHAMRISGQGFDDWGAMLGLSLVYESGGQGPYDASNREGVTFWARIGDTSTDRVRFALSDVNSQPEGGLCEPEGPPEVACYDTYGTLLTQLGVTWKRYRIPFDGLTQREFGLQADLATDALYSIQFTFEPGAVFDLWVDDIEFY